MFSLLIGERISTMTSKQQMIDAVSALLVLAQDLSEGDAGLLQQIADLQAQVAGLQAQLQSAQDALQAEIALEQADAAQVIALNAKIQAALSALQA